MRVLLIVVSTLTACSGDPEPPTYSHDEPDETMAETCVLCHSCGNDGVDTTMSAPSPGDDHPVCNDCHGTDPVEHNCDGSNCDWQKSCNDPAYANCSQCHASGSPQKTIAQVNDACRFCHDKE